MSEQSTTAPLARLAATPLTGQLARFAVVGATNTALTWCVFAMATAAGLWYPAAAAVAFAAGAVNGYTLNRVWTFQAGAFHPRSLGRYVLVQLVGMGLNVLLVIGFVEAAGLHRLTAQLFAVPLVSALTFVLSRAWAFAAV